MGHTPDEITQTLAERLCGEIARREAGAVLDDCFHFLPAIGVMRLLEEAHGAAVQRAMVPVVPYVVLDGLKTLCGIDSINALPLLLCSAEALMPLVGVKAQQVRQGVCQRGATKRQGERLPGPICPATLAKNIVKWNLRDLAMVLKGAMRALAKAGVVGAKVTGLADGPALETTARDTGCGQVTRPVRLAETPGPRHNSEVTVYGWNVFRWIDAVTKMPLAVTVGQLHAHEARWARALVTQARLTWAGHARLHTVVLDQGLWDGPTLWWLDQPGRHGVVPANTTRAVTADARAPAAAGDARTVGRRVDTVRHGQGRTAWAERLETAVGGLTGLTTDDQDGSPEQGRQPHRRDFQPKPHQRGGGAPVAGQG